MKLALLLDCYGVLYVRPVELYLSRYPELRQDISDLYKSFNYGSISVDDFIDEIAGLTGDDKSEVKIMFNRGLVLISPLVKSIKDNLSDMYYFYVLSNTTQSDLDRLCDVEELRGLPVKSWYSSELLGATKPAKESFDRATGYIGDAEGFVLVDDLEQNIRGANLAGWSGVHYTDIESTVSSLEEIYYARAARS